MTFSISIDFSRKGKTTLVIRSSGVEKSIQMGGVHDAQYALVTESENGFYLSRHTTKKATIKKIAQIKRYAHRDVFRKITILGRWGNYIRESDLAYGSISPLTQFTCL